MAKAKPNLPELTTASDWLGAIAASAGVEPMAAKAALDRHGVEPQPTLPRPRTLGIREITLRGIKEGTTADGSFSFEWKDLGPGLWAVLSDRNLRGKSTILNVLRSAIRGDFPGRIKPDIWRWLAVAEVRFGIDGLLFRTLVEKTPGEEDPRKVRARLSRFQGERWIDLYDGPPGDRLQAQTEAVFMEELSFAKFHAFNATHEIIHPHGWPAMSAALFVSEPGVAIFGDQTVDALPLRLLQLFMGLPWISTYTMAQAAAKQVEAAAIRPRDATAGLERLKARALQVEADLVEARRKQATYPDRASLRSQLLADDAALVRLTAERAAAQGDSDKKRAEHAAALAVVVTLKQDLQQARDELAAGMVFRRLRPVCCPACEASIGSERYQARDMMTCALCGTEETGWEDQEEQDRIGDLAANTVDAEAVAARLGAEATAAERRIRHIEAMIGRASASIEKLQSTLDKPGAEDADRTVAILEARLDELRELIAAEAATSASAEDADLAVLKAAEAITKRIFEGRQADILRDLSSAILRYSQEFGIQNLAGMELRANILEVRQGGSTLTFSKLSPGEKLRVRIAAALAMVQVAQVRGYGRHPGLLVLDSPGSQEMTEGDFAALLASVQRTVSEVQGFQIIVGAVARPELGDVVPSQQRRHAEGDSFLF